MTKLGRIVLLLAAVIFLSAGAGLAQTHTGPIPSSFFGMNVINAGSWPSVPVGALGKGAFSWGYLEPARGQLSWARLDAYVNEAQSHGVSVMYSNSGVPKWAASNTSSCHENAYGTYCSSGVVDVQDWNNFVTDLVSRYKGRIQVYELWNEPQQYFTGTMAELVTLTQNEYNIIRSIDPGATILSPAMVSYGYPYLDSYLGAGGPRNIDGVSIHTYPSPSNDIAETVTTSMTTTILSVMSKHGLTGKRLWDTEGSWGNAQSGAITDASLQSAFVARSHLLQWSAGIERFYWYAWDDPNWGTLEGRPAAIAYQQVYNWMNGATMAQPCSTNGASSPYHAVYTCDLTRSGGYLGKAVWDTDGNSTYAAQSQYVHYRDLQGNLHGIPSNHEVSIGKEPILLEGTETVSTGSTGTQTQGSAFKLTSISPSSVKAGSADFTLTVSGSGFIHGAIVSWNGSGRFRTYVNNTTMTARISARDVAAAGTARLTVTNPIPGEAVPQSGCGCPTTNAITLTITP
jgi:Beta-galactosidase